MGYKQPNLIWSAVILHDQADMVQFKLLLKVSTQLEGKKKTLTLPMAQLCHQGRCCICNESLTLRACHIALQRCGLKMLL